MRHRESHWSGYAWLGLIVFVLLLFASRPSTVEQDAKTQTFSALFATTPTPRPTEFVALPATPTSLPAASNATVKFRVDFIRLETMAEGQKLYAAVTNLTEVDQSVNTGMFWFRDGRGVTYKDSGSASAILKPGESTPVELEIPTKALPLTVVFDDGEQTLEVLMG